MFSTVQFLFGGKLPSPMAILYVLMNKKGKGSPYSTTELSELRVPELIPVCSRLSACR